ncbi:hypothetical protein ACFWXK_24950 [Streptomyces sp. NPDC059070]|uniref:hypothetical protein n=1 Tax=Streptomyces sp. NPDC059070 TaxID=3346713 RepID=UPI0036BE3C7B
MEDTYLVRLTFGAPGPAIEGEWSVPGTARDRYTARIGLHGANPAAVIRLIEKSGGRQRVDRTWTARGEILGARPPVPEERAR